MKFKRLQIDNIRSYQSLDLDFKDGVTVISGVNGSGKSSILEACFMGIFGGEVLRGTTLQIFDMIRKGSSKASIVLDFEHGGADYQIEQHYRVTKTGANNSKSILKKNGEIIAEKSNNTYEAIKNLLNMDEVSFQNCAYIRQGDVDALINAKPRERQQMIDDLLRLGKLEEYRERAHSSKTAVTRVLRSETEKKDLLDVKISHLRNKNPYHELNRRKEAVEKIGALLLEQTREKDKLSAELTLLESKLKEIEKEKAEIEGLKKESSDLTLKYEAEILKQENLLSEIQSATKKKNQLSETSEKLRIETNRSNAETIFLKEDSHFYIGETGDKSRIESVLSNIKNEESQALSEKHDFSKKAEIIGVQKNNLQKDISAKEKEISDSGKAVSALSSQIEQQILKINAANASVEGGFLTAGTEKKAFLEIFDELYNDILSSKSPIPKPGAVSGFDSDADLNSKKDCISDVCDISFYSTVVKAEDLPLPSAESSWRTLISDIENLENYIVSKVREEETKVTEEEKKKAALKGELEEKSKNRDEIQKELNRLDEEIEKVQLKLKTELAESEIKKKRISDFEALFKMHQSKRADKIRSASALKETVPASRYSLGDISPKDVANAISVLSQKKEMLISENAGLESSDREIEKSILKKEALLKAGKCPTCGQEISSDSVHKHEAADEAKQREEIALRLKEIQKFQKETDFQISILKEISEIDSDIEQIQSEINTHRAEEKGKSELISKFKKDLEDINDQKKTVHARYLEHSVFCEAHQKSLKTIEGKLSDFKSVALRRQEKLKLLSNRKKSFTDSSNSILMDYKTLEAERKMNADSQKRLDELKNTMEIFQKSLNQLKSDFEKIAADEIQIKAEVEAAMKKLEFISNTRFNIERIVEFNREQETLNAVITGFKSTLGALTQTLENYQTQISEKTLKAQTLTEKINAGLSSNGGSSLLEKKKSLSAQIESISKNADDLNATKMNILEEIGKIRSEIEQLAENEKESLLLRNKLLFLSYVSEDVSVLEEMYLRIRAEMRAKNIEALDILLNEMFDFIYSNNAYSHLELDGEYNLKVHEKDGSILEPKQLSGGERAIFNLALRCAIYRLLSLGFGEQNTGQTSLPPLIFDEPTVFLDSGHIRQLIKLIEHMRQDGVGQIIVVSHDESLIDSADVNFKVEKDPLTNASRIV